MRRNLVVVALLATSAFLVMPRVAFAQRYYGGAYVGGYYGGARIGGYYGGYADYARAGNQLYYGLYGPYRGYGYYAARGYTSPDYYGYRPYGAYGDYSSNYYLPSYNDYLPSYYDYLPTYSSVRSAPAYRSLPSAPTLTTSAYPTNPNISPDAAQLRVLVPENARVWLQGQATSKQGGERQFYSPPLTPGQNYTYTVRAQWTDASGQTVNRTKQVTVRAGDYVNVNFYVGS